jgi:mRNA interferase MazF
MIRGEIWWAQFGIPSGSEAGYKRPVLIVQDDSFNKSGIKTIVVLPLTTNLRLLYALDRQRFIEKISKVPKGIMDKVENGMMLVLGINR